MSEVTPMSDLMSRQGVLAHLKKQAGSPRPGYLVCSVAHSLHLSVDVVQEVFDELLSEGLAVVRTRVHCADGHLLRMSGFGPTKEGYAGGGQCIEGEDYGRDACGADVSPPQHIYSHSDKLRALWQAEPSPPSPLMIQLCGAAGVDPNGQTWDSLAAVIRAMRSSLG